MKAGDQAGCHGGLFGLEAIHQLVPSSRPRETGSWVAAARCCDAQKTLQRFGKSSLRAQSPADPCGDSRDNYE